MNAALAYLLVISLVILGSAIAGWTVARMTSIKVERNRNRFLISGLFAFAFWCALSWGARFYGETEYPGWAWAEWWAHQGKWYFFLGLALFGIVLGLVAEFDRIQATHKLLIPPIIIAVVFIAVHRSYPVYLMLGTGQRDVNGYLIQDIDHEYTCGAVALLNYLEIYQGHENLTEREVSRACHTTVEGATMSDLLKAVHGYGLTNATCQRRTYDEILDTELPLIVSISTLPGLRHATLLVKLDGDTATFIDPSYGPWQCSLERLREILYGKSIAFGITDGGNED